MRTRYITIDEIYYILLKIITDDGIEGQGLIRAASFADIDIVEKII